MRAFGLLSLAAALSSVVAIPATDSSYFTRHDGVKVLRVPVGGDTTSLDGLISSLHLERWTEVSVPNSHVDVEVPKEKYDQFVTAVKKISMKDNVPLGITVMHEDLGKSIRAESEGLFKASAPAGEFATDAWFKQYHSYADHLTFLRELVDKFPHNSKIVTSGTSLEGRTITGINVFGVNGSGKKPAIIVHGTVHAREWISTMVTESFAYNLLSNYSSGDVEIQKYVNKYDFYFFPVVNPDGFVYTQTTSRLWRKNRSSPLSGGTCFGTDINRNWAHSSWGQTVSLGGSHNSCSGEYRGPSPASAPETQGITEFLDARASSAAGAKMYLDVHSYSQVFMTPYGYTCSKIPPDATELNSLAAGYVSALSALFGTSYDSGPICPTLYPVSGDGVDYAYDNAKIKYSFATELRDTGNNGFILPASEIIPSVVENWAGFKYLLANMK